MYQYRTILYPPVRERQLGLQSFVFVCTLEPILIEKHIRLPTPRPIYAFRKILPAPTLQFFMLNNVVVVLFRKSAY